MARSAVLRTVRDWEAKLAPHIAQVIRTNRHGKTGESWYVDETYVKVGGQRTDLYRASDRNQKLVDVRLSKTCDMTVAKAFFAEALEVTGKVPNRVTSDGHDAYPGAIRDELGCEVVHRTNQYLNNHLEQDHRGVKQRYFQCAGSRASSRPTVSVGLSMSCGIFSDHNADDGNTILSHTDVSFTSAG